MMRECRVCPTPPHTPTPHTELAILWSAWRRKAALAPHLHAHTPHPTPAHHLAERMAQEGGVGPTPPCTHPTPHTSPPSCGEHGAGRRRWPHTSMHTPHTPHPAHHLAESMAQEGGVGRAVGSERAARGSNKGRVSRGRRRVAAGAGS
eukprot:359171-Chlamydomonas_euryale.AAC.2